MEKQEILKELGNFSGTENYYKSSFGSLSLTDGMQYLREALNCYWLIDIVESVQHLPKIKENSDFILWRIIVNKDKSFLVEAFRDMPYNADNLLYSQKAEYTDFKLEGYEFYQCKDVLLLKGEY